MSADLSVTDTAWADAESVIRRFEDAWRTGRPDLAAFLSTDSSPKLVAELVHIDLEFRLRAGEPARAEDYLHKFPELATPAAAAELIAAEYRLRKRAGPQPAAAEYLERFPEYAAELHDLLADAALTQPLGPPPVALVGPPTVPGMQVHAEIGRGGMGVVYKAYQPALGRLVAVKTLAAVPGPEMAARFRREAEAMARLDHPNIAPVYQVGAWETGGRAVPFLVMKWYPGGSLDAAPCGPGTDPKSHAATVSAVARAVQHAHARGVLHRDLKPANVLLDEDGRPHVADFGLAAWYDPDDPQPGSTAVVGTPAYMAPEQAEGVGGVTTAADVYGLGAVLYHLLTGRPPFQGSTPLATLNKVTKEPPERLKNVPRDLETVCLKCLEKEPSRRYHSAEELADDLDRFLAGTPVRARPPGAIEQTVRLVRRYPLVCGLSALTATTFLFAVGNLIVSNDRIRKTELATRIAYQNETNARKDLEIVVGREQRSLDTERVAAAGRLYSANQLPPAWELLGRVRDTSRHWEWRYLDRRRRDATLPLLGHTEWVRAAVFLHDDRLATGDEAGEVRVWNPATGRLLLAFFITGRVNRMDAHPTRPWLAVTDTAGVSVRDADAGGAIVRQFPQAGRLKFSPCGRWAATTEYGGAVKVWELPGWRPHTLSDLPGRVSALTFNPTSDRLLIGTNDGVIRGFSPATGTAVGTGWRRPRSITGLAFTGDGSSLVESHPEGVVAADPATGRHRHRIDPAATGERAVAAVGPHPRWVAVPGPDGLVTVWDVESNKEPVREFRGHTGRVTALAFSRDGTRLASAGSDHGVRVWPLNREPDGRTLCEIGEDVGGLAVTADGKRIAVGPRLAINPADGKVRLIDPTTGEVIRQMPAVGDVAFHPNGRWLATGRPAGGVTVWDAETGQVVWEAAGKPDSAGPRLRFAPNGTRLAVWTRAGGVQLFTADGRPAGHIDTGGRFLSGLDYSPDGVHLALAAAGGLIVWEDGCSAPKAIAAPGPGAVAVAFSPDGRWLATADADRAIRVRAADTGEVVQTFLGGAVKVNVLAFSPDGGRLVTGGSDYTVRVWEPTTGRELLSLPGVRGPITGVAWDAAGDRVIALDSAVRVWEP